MWGGHVPGVWAFWGVLGSQGNNAIARALVGSIPAARALLSPWAYPCRHLVEALGDLRASSE